MERIEICFRNKEAATRRVIHSILGMFQESITCDVVIAAKTAGWEIRVEEGGFSLFVRHQAYHDDRDDLVVEVDSRGRMRLHVYSPEGWISVVKIAVNAIESAHTCEEAEEAAKMLAKAAQVLVSTWPTLSS